MANNALQFAKMVEWGMTPMEAIQSATSSAAQALDRTGDVGAIAAGRYGDLVAVDGDPLADIRTLERPSFVMKGGMVVRGGSAGKAILEEGRSSQAPPLQGRGWGWGRSSRTNLSARHGPTPTPP